MAVILPRCNLLLFLLLLPSLRHLTHLVCSLALRSMKQSRRLHRWFSRPRVVLRKWLNISDKNSDYSADSSGNDDEDDSLTRCNDTIATASFSEEQTPILRRRNSETFRTQYIDKKDIRICVGTWNVGGEIPPDELMIDEWLENSEPADVYVLGLQEVVPLNAGNIFGPEDSRPVLAWESIIRESLNKVKPIKKYKSFSDPPSPSRYRPSEDAPDIEEEVSLETDSEEEDGEVVIPLEEKPYGFYEVRDKAFAEDGSSTELGVSDGQETFRQQDLQSQSFSVIRRLDRFHLDLHKENEEKSKQAPVKLCKVLSGTETLGLSWPEPPLNLLGQHVVDMRSGNSIRGRSITRSFKTTKSLKAAKSFKTYNSFKLLTENERSRDVSLLTNLDLESLIYRKRKPEYARIVSKQMVGIFLTIWVRRGLRKHIHNLNVSTVGVGVMGYIGNKGSVSVSMSIYQTLFCFVCTHLTAGDKVGDELKRNADVHVIHRRTNFCPVNQTRFPKYIHDHERIIWLGDLNYRINLQDDETKALITKRQWTKLLEKDQLMQELKVGRAFEGWSEGKLEFPPTYKYELNSEKYTGDDPKTGRRNPAWCDRILSYGNGLNLQKYTRAELRLSDHRPVTAVYTAEVECFCTRKLQKALTFTDAEMENPKMVLDLGTTLALCHSRHE